MHYGPNSLKTIFLGSSDYCVPVVKTLYNNFRLEAVITRQDKPIGRKQTITASLPKKFALSHNVHVFSPSNKKGLLVLKDCLKKLNPDICIVADYGLIIPKEIFALPKYRTVNIHFSKLPKFRGPSPIQFTILYGEKSAWISFVLIDEGLDTGEILTQIEVLLKGNETTDILYKKLFEIAAEKLPEVIKFYTQNKLSTKKQNHSKAIYTKLLTREDGHIPGIILKKAISGISLASKDLMRWDLYNKHLSFNKLPNVKCQASLVVERAIRALSPWPSVWTEITIKQCDNATMRQCKKRLKIIKAHLIATNNRQQTKEFKLVLDQVQLEGKRVVSWKQFQEGYPNYSFQ